MYRKEKYTTLHNMTAWRDTSILEDSGEWLAVAQKHTISMCKYIDKNNIIKSMSKMGAKSYDYNRIQNIYKYIYTTYFGIKVYVGIVSVVTVFSI